MTHNFPKDYYPAAERICALAAQKSLRGLVVETCTGGLLSALLSQVSGSSRYFLAGLTLYDNQIKTDLLAADKALMIKKGAVSAEACQDLSQSALNLFPLADFCLALTGIAGPQGGSIDKPVGLCYLNLQFHPRWAAQNKQLCQHFCDQDRWLYRLEALHAACALLESELAQFSRE